MYVNIDSNGKIHSDDTAFNTFENVISSNDGSHYFWKEFHGYYDTLTDAYYWASGEGCSCDSVSMYIETLGDFESSKSKDDMQRAFDSYRKLGLGNVPVSNAIRDYQKPTKK